MTDTADEDHFVRVTDPGGESFQIQVSSASGGSGPVFLHAPGAPGFLNGLLRPVNLLLRAVQPAVRHHQFFSVIIVRERDEEAYMDDRRFKTAAQAETEVERVAKQVRDGTLKPAEQWWSF